jgi:hypothetical protein
MRLSKQEKARRRDHRWRLLRWKRYKGDHDYWTKKVRADELGFQLVPFPIIVRGPSVMFNY